MMRRILAGTLACGAWLWIVTADPRSAGEADTWTEAAAASVPSTPFPAFKGCSSEQEAYLKQAWRRAHTYTWHANRLLAHIMSRNEAGRAELWNHDHLLDSVQSTSPRSWFGPYNKDRAERVREAVDKALRRFEQRGQHVKAISTIRCGQPIAPKKDAQIDVCPASNPKGDGPPPAYHFPIGTIVTCPAFWETSQGSPEHLLSLSARGLVHEVFHWLSVGGKYVTDHHGDGVKGLPDKKYYSFDNAFYLARHRPSWAIYNNDNYAWFIRAVGISEPFFSAVFAPKEGSGTGGLYFDLTWDQLVERWKALGSGQYLADVETYVKDGQRRYAALWRVGKGNGALYAARWPEFTKQWTALKGTQDLIDIEVYPSGGSMMYLGVFRQKQAKTGDGGLFTGLSWEELAKKHKEYAASAYLVDVETYVENGQRKFAAVWRAGKGAGALYWYREWSDFETKKKELDRSQQLIDFERFITGDGRWNFLGVWKAAEPSDVLLRRLSRGDLIQTWKERSAVATLVDIEEFTPLPARIK